MKKIIFAVLFIGSTCAVVAQEKYKLKTDDQKIKIESDKAYGAKISTPPIVLLNFQRDYPQAADVIWQPIGPWWMATFNYSGKPTTIYYSQMGTAFTVALPVLYGFVPEDVISKAKQTYGNLYSITRMKGSNNQDIYQLVTLENGGTKTIWINEDGSITTDIYRTDLTDMNRHELNNPANTQATTPNPNPNVNVTATDMSNAAINTNTSDKTKTNDWKLKQEKDKLKIKKLNNNKDQLNNNNNKDQQ
ncbi:MAG: hypothetical protein ICV66_14385 [Chitinophagaceae bacterium]|nr:hypothetical protein [Chitinophagaceae bacterium]